MRKKELVLLVITVSVFVIIYALYLSHTIDDFVYAQVADVISLLNMHYISLTTTNIGFIIYSTILVIVTNISPFLLPLIPLQEIPILLLLIAIIRKISNYNLYTYLIVIVYVISGTSPNMTNWFCHYTGLILLLTIVYVYLLNYTNSKMELSLLLIIVLISLNFISYKMIAYALVFISSVIIIELLEHRLIGKTSKKRRISLLNIGLIGCVATLSFNYFFYNVFIPIAQDPTRLSTINGIEKFLFQYLNLSKLDPLAAYFYQVRFPAIFYLNSKIYYAIILILIGSFIKIVIDDIIKKKVVTQDLKMILAVLISIIIMSAAYAVLGYLDLFLLTICILFILGVLVRYRKYMIIFIPSLLFLIIFNISTLSFLSWNHIYSGQKDNSDFKYLQSFSSWYDKSEINSYQQHIATDVLTREIVFAYLSEHNLISYTCSSVFTTEQLSILLGLKQEAIPTEKEQYIINFKEDYFSIMGWNEFVSWSKIGTNIENRNSLDCIYSSGDLSLFVTS